jgi:predicted secreted hydrolase
MALPATPPLHLPADAAMHPDAQTEWWYCTGRVAAAAGQTYGVDVTFIKRFAVQRYFPDAPYDALYRDDVALTDEAARQFHSALTFLWPALTATVVSTQELAIQAGPIRMSTLPGLYRYQIHGSLPDGAIDLTLAAARPPLFIGGGLIPWGRGYSYYYSFTQLRAAGTITLAGRPRAVQGTIWMDHQWGTWPRGDLRPIGWDGWQWMGLRLADGTNIDLTNIRASGGGLLRGAAVLHADNTQSALVLGVVMTPLGSWRSPRTHILYPSGWRVQIPAERLDVRVYPTVRDQEMVYGGPPAAYLGETTYWEGDSVVSGWHAGHAVQGAAYTELMGYGWPPPA